MWCALWKSDSYIKVFVGTNIFFFFFFFFNVDVRASLRACGNVDVRASLRACGNVDVRVSLHHMIIF